jgi:hypothetical protein
MSVNASISIADKYSEKNMFQNMKAYYNKTICHSKSIIDFNSALGNNSYEWYTSCQGVDSNTSHNYEDTKGSLKHYLSYFPNDKALLDLAKPPQG